jgi:hypothetical protein
MHRLIVDIRGNGFEIPVGHAVGFLLIANEML